MEHGIPFKEMVEYTETPYLTNHQINCKFALP